MSASEIAVIALAETNAVGYGLGTMAQTFTSINNLATELVYSVEGNNTKTNSDPTQGEAIFLFIIVLSLSAAFFKALFYFFNAEVTNRILFSSWISTDNKLSDLEMLDAPEDGTITLEEQETTLLVAETKSQKNNCIIYFNQAKPYFRMAGQFYGSFVGIALPNGGSMLLQTLSWGVPFAPAMTIAALTMGTNLVSIYSILKFGNRENPKEREQTVEQLQAFTSGMVLDNSETRFMPTKKMLAKILIYFCAVGYGAGTAIQAFTLNQKLTKDLFLLLEGDSNDSNTSSALAWFYSFLFFNVTTSLCKGESYIYNALTTNAFLFDDLLSIHESDAKAQETEPLYSKFRLYFTTARQLWGALGATAAPNSGSIYLQAANVGLKPAVAATAGGVTLVTTGFSVYGLFKHGTRSRQELQQQETISTGPRLVIN